jgi:branched-chain amino acid transport system substrate-binding protein
MAYSIGKPRVRPTSSPSAASSTRSRSGRRPIVTARRPVDLTLGELAKRLGKSPADLRIALLWENRAFGKSVGDSIRAYAKEKSVNLVYDEGYDQFLTDMTPIVQRLKDVKPDVLIAISFPNDAILFQRKAKELDFNVGALVGVSAGYSNPDLRDSIGDMVNGIFVSDFAARVNPKALTPDTLKIADEFFKRYDDKMKRPPAGHASSAFSATWALFTEVFPKAKSVRAGGAARDRAQARPARGQPRQRQRHQVHQQ